MDKRKTIVIVGAGFAGITCALRLAKRKLKNVRIVLVSQHAYFEYYPAMYRLVTGSSPLQACLSLDEIFQGTGVEVVEDRVIDLDVAAKKAIGISGSVYSADMLVLAVGSEMSYFNIEGVEKFSFNFKSIHHALHLKNRIIELFKENHAKKPEEAFPSLRFVVVGGGASGVELAGELASYTRKLSRVYNVDRSLVTVDLVEGAPRILRTFSEKVSERATDRLHRLGVNVYANQLLVSSEEKAVHLRDMDLSTKTLIWTAGVTNNSLYKSIVNQCEFDGRGRAIVDDFLQLPQHPGVFVAGDNASTPFAGLAQTAIHDGEYIAKYISDTLRRREPKKYRAKQVSYDVPIGPGWAVLVTHGITLFGWVPWVMRHVIDLRFYLMILPFRKALTRFFIGCKEDELPGANNTTLCQKE